MLYSQKNKNKNLIACIIFLLNWSWESFIMKKRLKSLDFFRGVCITWMIFGHLAEWWMSFDSFLLLNELILFVDAIGGTGFLFISGVSLTLSYRNKIKRIKNEGDYSYKRLRLNYLLRAVFLFIVGIIYNTIDALISNNLSLIWNWFILTTLPASIILAWPLLRYKKLTKILVAVIVLLVDHFLFLYLKPFQYQIGHPLSIVYYFLYNGYQLTPILSHFPFFIVGSVIADIIYEKYIHQEPEIPNIKFLKKITFPIILSGIILILAAFLLVPFPVIVEEFLWQRRNIAWITYAIGLLMIVYPSLFYIEKLNVIQINKKYRFFFYFSYYSFSIFLLHYSLYFLFTHGLTLNVFLPVIMITIFLIGLLLKLIYRKLGNLFSLKYQLSRLADGITTELIKILPELQKSDSLSI